MSYLKLFTTTELLLPYIYFSFSLTTYPSPLLRYSIKNFQTSFSYSFSIMKGLLPRRKLQIWISLCKSFKIQLYNLEASCLHITIIFIMMCVECCDKQCGTSLKWNVRDVKSSCQVEDIFLCLLIKHILISIISIWYLNIIISAEGGKVDAWRSVMLSRVVLFTLDRGKRSENYQKYMQARL